MELRNLLKKALKGCAKIILSIIRKILECIAVIYIVITVFVFTSITYEVLKHREVEIVSMELMRWYIFSVLNMAIIITIYMVSKIIEVRTNYKKKYEDKFLDCEKKISKSEEKSTNCKEKRLGCEVDGDEQYSDYEKRCSEYEKKCSDYERQCLAYDLNTY